jgi:2-aminoethylphosphonate-pyruvate transaminase
MLAAHGRPVTMAAAPWTAGIDLDAVARRLDAGEVTHVVAVHHETTTGRLNEIAPLVDVCRREGVELLVDAVSSFGAEALEFDAPELAAVAGTANKCLHGIPGLSFAIVRRGALARGCAPPRTLSLDLLEHHTEQERASTSFTPPIPAFHALCEALRELAECGGRAARHARYRELAERVAAGLAKLGIEPYLPSSESSVVLRSYRLPCGLAYDTLHDELKKRGFVIYAGQGGLGSELFRISTMGEIADDDIERLLRAFDEIVRSEGRKSR